MAVVAVRHAHAAAMPELAPYVSDAETWTERLALYRSLLARLSTLLLLVLDRETVVGYALAHVREARDTWIADTRQTGARVAEIELISVLPEYRDEGVGRHCTMRLTANWSASGSTT